jgi:hypothetical protein
MKTKAIATSHPGISDFTALKAAYAQATPAFRSCGGRLVRESVG